MKLRLSLALLPALLLCQPAHADITIAAVGPLTGQDASTGEQMRYGAEAAVADINANGGVLGQKLRLIERDDVCDPKQSVAVANELSGLGVFAVVGPMCSGSAIPASRTYNEEGILMISPSATSPTLTQQGFDNVFRTCAQDEIQGKIVADFIVKKFAGKHIAVIDDKTAYGRGLADVVRTELKKQGVTIKMDDSVSRGERDYSSLVSKLKEKDIDALFYGGYHTEAGLIVRQMRDQALTTVFISDDDLTTREFWSVTGNAGEGTFMSFNADPRARPEAAEAVAKLRAKGFNPEGNTLYTYAAVQVMVEAIRRANTTQLTKVIAALREGSYPTVIGPLSFDSKGDITRLDYIIYRWSNGDYTPYEE
ncbi:MAG: branched-chain amino acid ABC transporter substrate-binding protein [Alphaproteobacteria bacterium]|nr:branched-chain amino acid ABC transporter substrate-binding protein [Alphaproteobacteria bacterium]MBV8548845.1 branched-chain amino acid ABC transporter substrate-binding protein [Alphaproteobacteria bacterium]